MSNKLTVIVDGNYHFHKTLHVYGHAGKDPMLTSERDIEMFMKKIAMDFAFAIRQIGKPDRLILTIDKNSWRKEVEIEENTGYKGNRVKDDSVVNWANFNACMKEFGEILKSFGCIVSTIDGCEGDDLMYYWANKLYEDGEDVVIITGDGDINQLVKHNSTNFITVFNTRSSVRKVVAAPGFREFLDDNQVSLLDSFSFMGSNKDAMKSLIDATELVEIEPNDVLFDKILMGDAGDNVPPIISWQETQKTGKVINKSITAAKLARLKELLSIRGKQMDSKHLYEHAADISREIKNIYDKELTVELAKKRIERNTILVYLSDETIPSRLRDAFEQHYEQTKNLGYPKIEKWDMHTLLANTKYKGSQSFESDVFKAFKSAPPKQKEREIDNDKNSKKLF